MVKWQQGQTPAAKKGGIEVESLPKLKRTCKRAMEEFTSRPLYHMQGAPLDLRRCCTAFQSWLDERRRMRGGRRTDWKERRRKFKQARQREFQQQREGRDSLQYPIPFWSLFARERRKVSWFSVSRIIAYAREAGELTPIQKDVLAERLRRWLTSSYYAGFLRCLHMEPFFFEEYLEPQDEDHYRKYMLFAFCAFLGFFRRSFNWQESAEHRKLAASLLEIFGKLDQEENPRRRTSALRKFITLLFDSREELEDIEGQMTPQAGQPSSAIQDKHYPLVREAYLKFESWEERIAYLHKNRVPYLGKSIAVAYKEKHSAVVRTLQRVTKELNT
jgi:hypothetical protein